MSTAQQQPNQSHHLLAYYDRDMQEPCLKVRFHHSKCTSKDTLGRGLGRNSFCHQDTRTEVVGRELVLMQAPAPLNTIAKLPVPYPVTYSPKVTHVRPVAPSLFTPSGRRACHGWTGSYFGARPKLPNCLECALSFPITSYRQAPSRETIQTGLTRTMPSARPNTRRFRSYQRICWSSFTASPISTFSLSSCSTGFQL